MHLSKAGLFHNPPRRLRVEGKCASPSLETGATPPAVEAAEAATPHGTGNHALKPLQPVVAEAVGQVAAQPYRIRDAALRASLKAPGCHDNEVGIVSHDEIVREHRLHEGPIFAERDGWHAADPAVGRQPRCQTGAGAAPVVWLGVAG